MAKPRSSTKARLPRFDAVAFAAGLDGAQARGARTLLEDLQHPQLGLRRYLYVNDPIEATERVKIHAAEALFPEALLTLRNRYITLPGGIGSDLFRDGVDLLCLSVVLRRPGLVGAILVRGGFDLGRVPAWLESGRGPVLEIGSDRRPDAAIAFRNTDPALPGLIGAAQELYQTGAVLGLPDYSLARVLQLAEEISA